MKRDGSDAALGTGAGPSLAAALASRGIRAVMLDRAPEGASASRVAMHARTLEIFATSGDSVPAAVIARSWRSKS